MKYTIFDLDNCLADDAWRIPRINWQVTGDRRYHEYHALAPFDEPGNQETWFREAAAGNTPIIFTGRPVLFAAATMEWIKRRLNRDPMVMCRPDNSRLDSIELKRWMLSNLWHYGVEPGDIAGAYDDRPEIVKMYIGHGIDAKVLKIHDVCAYSNPLTGAPAFSTAPRRLTPDEMNAIATGMGSSLP